MKYSSRKTEIVFSRKAYIIFVLFTTSKKKFLQCMQRNIVNQIAFVTADCIVSTVCCIEVVCNAQEKGTVTSFSQSFAFLSLRLSIKTVSVLISRFISLVKLPLKQQPWECALFSAELEESGGRLKGSFALTAVQSAWSVGNRSICLAAFWASNSVRCWRPFWMPERVES